MHDMSGMRNRDSSGQISNDSGRRATIGGATIINKTCLSKRDVRLASAVCMLGPLPSPSLIDDRPSHSLTWTDFQDEYASLLMLTMLV